LKKKKKNTKKKRGFRRLQPLDRNSVSFLT